MTNYTHFLSRDFSQKSTWEKAKDLGLDFLTVIPVIGIWTGVQKLINMNSDLDVLGKIFLVTSAVLEIYGAGIVPRVIDLFLLTCTDLRT